MGLSLAVPSAGQDCNLTPVEQIACFSSVGRQHLPHEVYVNIRTSLLQVFWITLASLNSGWQLFTSTSLGFNCFGETCVPPFMWCQVSDKHVPLLRPPRTHTCIYTQACIHMDLHAYTALWQAWSHLVDNQIALLCIFLFHSGRKSSIASYNWLCIRVNERQLSCKQKMKILKAQR